MTSRSHFLAVVRIYTRLASTEFRRYSTYRLAVVAGVATNSVFGFIRISVLGYAIASAGNDIAGYSFKAASTYVWLGQAYLAPLALMSWSELADRVKSGDIAVDLARPIDLQASWWARDLGRAAFALISRGISPMVVGALTIGLQLPTTWTSYPLGLLSLGLAVSISFTLRFAVNLTAFWVLDIRGFLTLYMVVVGLLSGLFVPVHFFPPWLQTIAYATPAPAILQQPIDVMSGRVIGGAALEVVGIQAAWLAATVALARLMQWGAARRLVVQGG